MDTTKYKYTHRNTLERPNNNMDTRLGHVFPYGQIPTKDTKENVWSRNLKIEQLYIYIAYISDTT